MYNKMKSVENTVHWQTLSLLSRTVYPDCGYRTIFGGALDSIRTSTNIDKVRAFHEKFYRSDNLTLIISGQIDPEKVFETLKPIQEKMSSYPKQELFIKPWTTSVERIKESQDIKV